ncbi:MAG: NTP transferase domain-containing protein [Desulfosarcina sp.]|jgi:CTP:molybdopterin cytidylyltransferase MocA
MSRFRAVSVIILAAGFSRRMHRFKPLLSLGGQSVLQRVVALYRQTGVTDIHVVTGYQSTRVATALAGQPVQVVRNPNPEKGMFSSVKAGINALSAKTRAFFIHPVDMPLVRPHTLAVLMAAFEANPSPVAHPVYDGRRGHPPLIHTGIKAEILSHDGRGGLRSLLAEYDTRAQTIPVADEGVLLDMDTAQDFRGLSIRLERSHMLSPDECRILMQQVVRLPVPVINHCRQVARVARALAGAVRKIRSDIDTDLVYTAALVHDLAKHQTNHAASGADLLNAMGFPAMAAIVATHMDMSVSSGTPVDEAQLVYLADKLVTGETVVGLGRRFDAKLKQVAPDSAAAVAIDRRRRAAWIIHDKVAQTTGRPIQQILAAAGIFCRW